MSPSTIIRLLDVLGENHDQKVIEWRDNLFQTLDKLLQVCAEAALTVRPLRPWPYHFSGKGVWSIQCPCGKLELPLYRYGLQLQLHCSFFEDCGELVAWVSASARVIHVREEKNSLPIVSGELVSFMELAILQ